MRDGEFIWNYLGIITDLTEEGVSHVMTGGLSYAQAIWRLYDMKMGMETYYKDLLSDLNLRGAKLNIYDVQSSEVDFVLWCKQAGSSVAVLCAQCKRGSHLFCFYLSSEDLAKTCTMLRQRKLATPNMAQIGG